MNKITKVLSTEQTVVDFFGIAVALPDGYNTITMDDNGAVYAHPEDCVVTPSVDGEWECVGSKPHRATYSKYICQVAYVGDWKEFVKVYDI